MWPPYRVQVWDYHVLTVADPLTRLLDLSDQVCPPTTCTALLWTTYMPISRGCVLQVVDGSLDLSSVLHTMDTLSPCVPCSFQYH